MKTEQKKEENVSSSLGVERALDPMQRLSIRCVTLDLVHSYLHVAQRPILQQKRKFNFTIN